MHGLIGWVALVQLGGAWAGTHKDRVLAVEADGKVMKAARADEWPWVAPATPSEGALAMKLPSTGTDSVHIIVALDITNSWEPEDFNRARKGVVALFDTMFDHSGWGSDRLGMVTYTGPFGIEQPPLATTAWHTWNRTRDDWARLATASKAGHPSPSARKGCRVDSGDTFEPDDPRFNEALHQAGGCHPHMFREYLDEYGTNHAVGLEMARVMFSEHAADNVYRALILITDGQPGGGRPHSARNKAGFEEKRWRFVTASPADAPEVARASIAGAEALHRQLGVHVWAVSFEQRAPMLDKLVQGDGFSTVTSNPRDLHQIVEHISDVMTRHR